MNLISIFVINPGNDFKDLHSYYRHSKNGIIKCYSVLARISAKVNVFISFVLTSMEYIRSFLCLLLVIIARETVARNIKI